ncbi:hypothetical protein NC651_010254 [Populus alba x Populus x berolinensis]|nr:hypothetical protein NC651_010254 [Populus alba x Populus x berolinensis]
MAIGQIPATRRRKLELDSVYFSSSLRFIEDNNGVCI